MRTTTFERLVFIGPAILYLIAFSVFPFFYSVGISLTDLNITRKDTGNFIGLGNYFQLFSEGSLFLKSVTNTFLIIILAVLIQMVVGFLIAQLFFVARDLRGISVLRTIYTIPIMITPLIFGLTWSYILNPMLGIMNYLFRLVHLKPLPWFGSPDTAIYTIIGVDIWQWTPFVVMLMLAGLLTVPSELLDAAEVDGAKWYQRVLYIEIPSIKRVIGIAVIMRVMELFRMFDIVYATTQGGPGGSTEVISMFAYRQSFNYYNIGIGSAASIIALILTIFLSTLFDKYSRE
ncbi:ABC transporter permease subunit [candidate division KSB3 bacterium]|uniref:ABC transporter permease subunit n=1 Tax=candidate division KSB3 bacterium TaxID=2044937 RepID=A0A9D5Q849_9BACT|nr:ABC transporter permease subunit [candidate division KSB3 bacterium]MBD3327615.1 ABC transporter permease subunit [candidate division KSB3 bacterium]